MFNFNLSDFSKKAILTLKKHSPEILTGVGIAGMLTTDRKSTRLNSSHRL
jgi:hypothetical protein